MTPKLRGLTFKFQKHLSSHNFCGSGVAGCLCSSLSKGYTQGIVQVCGLIWRLDREAVAFQAHSHDSRKDSATHRFQDLSHLMAVGWGFSQFLATWALHEVVAYNTAEREREWVTERKEKQHWYHSLFVTWVQLIHKSRNFSNVSPRRQGWPGARLKAAYYKEWDINFIKSLRFWGRWLLHLNLAYPYLIQFLFPIVQKKKLMLREI